MNEEKFERKNLGTPLGYLFSIYTIITHFIYPFSIWKYGFVGAVISNILRLSCYFIDEYTSNATEFNLKILDKNGYNGKEELKAGYIDYLKRTCTLYLVYQYFLMEAEVHFDLRLLLTVGTTFFLTEIYFTISHKWLHKSSPEWHKKHHCCLYPSLTSNFLFDKKDLLIEFTVPLLTALILNCIILKDPFAFMFSFGLINTWYTIDHDEYLKLPHWHHHHYINSNFSVYIPSSKFDEGDKVRHLVKR